MLPACQPQYNGPGWSAPYLAHCGIGEVFELFRFFTQCVTVCQWPSISITNLYTNFVPVFGYSLFRYYDLYFSPLYETYKTQVH